eukprot:59835-Pyramimonas_sp.AAC.1
MGSAGQRVGAVALEAEVAETHAHDLYVKIFNNISYGTLFPEISRWPHKYNGHTYSPSLGHQI